MKNYVLIGRWKVVPLTEIVFVMEILKEAVSVQEAFNGEPDMAYVN